MEVPDHLHAAPESVAQPVVIQVHGAKLGRDPTFLPTRHVVLTHTTKPHGVWAEPKLHQRRALQAGRRLPLEARDLDPLRKLHLTFGNRDQDVGVTIDDDGSFVELGGPCRRIVHRPPAGSFWMIGMQ